MKKLSTVLLIIGMMVFTGCTVGDEASRYGGAGSSGEYGDEVHVNEPNVHLDEYLDRLSGVQVRGNGRSADVNIRGATSFELDTTPLFIIDNVRMGNDFGQIYDIVDMTKVNNIRVIRSSRATTLYGSDGAHGAIVIKTESE